MEQQIMKKSYKLSHIILAILAFLIFNVMFINEDISWKFLSFIFSLITFRMSLPSSIISTKIGWVRLFPRRFTRSGRVTS